MNLIVGANLSIHNSILYMLIGKHIWYVCKLSGKLGMYTVNNLTCFVISFVCVFGFRTISTHTDRSSWLYLKEELYNM